MIGAKVLFDKLFNEWSSKIFQQYVKVRQSR